MIFDKARFKSRKPFVDNFPPLFFNIFDRVFNNFIDRESALFFRPLPGFRQLAPPTTNYSKKIYYLSFNEVIS